MATAVHQVLFFGPPGTGKTLVARALANTCSRAGKKVRAATWQSMRLMIIIAVLYAVLDAVLTLQPLVTRG